MAAELSAALANVSKFNLEKKEDGGYKVYINTDSDNGITVELSDDEMDSFQNSRTEQGVKSTYEDTIQEGTGVFSSAIANMKRFALSVIDRLLNFFSGDDKKVESLDYENKDGKTSMDFKDGTGNKLGSARSVKRNDTSSQINEYSQDGTNTIAHVINSSGTTFSWYRENGKYTKEITTSTQGEITARKELSYNDDGTVNIKESDEQGRAKVTYYNLKKGSLSVNDSWESKTTYEYNENGISENCYLHNNSSTLNLNDSKKANSTITVYNSNGEIIGITKYDENGNLTSGKTEYKDSDTPMSQWPSYKMVQNYGGYSHGQLACKNQYDKIEYYNITSCEVTDEHTIKQTLSTESEENYATRIVTLDDNGNITEEKLVEYENEQNVLLMNKFSYIDDGNGSGLIETFDSNGNKLYSRNYLYNKDGSFSTTTFDKYGRKTESSNVRANGIIQSKKIYNPATGRLKQMQYYDKNGKLIYTLINRRRYSRLISNTDK